MSSCSRTIPGLDASGEENFDGFGDTGDIDATESLLDIGMETEEEELGEESPNEEDGEQNGSAEHVVFGRAQILEMEFANPDEACRFYEQYSRAKGFAMRQGKKLKNRKGEIVRYTYLCNREGFRDRKWLEMQDRKREHKVVTRCGCQAEMRIKQKAESNNWYVSRFVDEHNHDLLPAKFVSYLPAYRKISDVDRAHMESLRQVGAEQNMCDLFWSDGRSQDDYKLFGDVLAFDATYGRNKYNLPVIVFSGVNHHNQTCVFGAAMVSSETQASYEVFPEAHHRLCAWHLLKNATVNVCKPRFTTLLRNCMLADVEVEKFERQWEAMMDECLVREVEWVKDLYTKKMAWATAYIRGCFYAGLRTTSRCESLHAKMGRFVERRYGILDFVTNFQRCVEFLRDNEEELDFRSLYGSPVLQTQFPELEKSGAVNYTREIFLRFREALKSSVRVTIVECKKLEDRTVYVTQKYRRPQSRWTVAHHFGTDSFFCSCMRMESFGLPCVHILAVLVQLDIGYLPKSLVLQRWSKTAKVEIEGPSIMNEPGEANEVYRSRMGAFLQHCKRLARVACMRESDFKSCLDRIVEETYVLEMKNGVGTAAQGTAAGGQDGVRDPVAVRTKGTGRAQEPFGCRGIKRRKCSNCGVVGHRRTRCPSGPCSQPVCTQDLAEGALGRDDSQSHGTVSGNDKQSKSRRRTVHVTSTPLHDA
ncbi:protein FAR1-RELATED SEQUENCE 5-like [Arachis duranensis]|uniref:Protein FAR1-RELATED SEQUENCE 5-like n=1 Tax=Arachis duranensis TaxID=130453 RepID=A0A6P5MLT5_ARADU|nr:protein FAR1-RELATED SEQUENCE 5-like [Arachis duranensis]